jgi:hypothetical protein
MAISNGSALEAAAAPGSILSIGSSGSILSIGSSGSILSIGSSGSILSIGSAGSVLSIGSVGSLACVLSAGSLASIGSVLSGFSSWSLRAWRGQVRQRQGRQLAGSQCDRSRPGSALRPAGSPTGNGTGAPLQ